MWNSKLFLSFFLFFFSICFRSSSLNDTYECSAQQSLALLLFKQSLLSINYSVDRPPYNSPCYDWLGFEYHPVMMNWKKSSDCCKWDGVTCNHFTGDVIALDLSCGMLRGTIRPNTTLLNLPRLQKLNLAHNDITGTNFLPEVIGRFASSLTHLNVSYCWFAGQIPPEISFLPKLVSLDLSWSYWPLRLDSYVLNNLLQNSTCLRELYGASVDISWVLPTYLNISSSLHTLDLRKTGLQGKLPYNIFNLQYVEVLGLGWNAKLTGPIPKVNMTTSTPLKSLDLSYTFFSTGEVIDSIGHLRSLNYLDLSYTNSSREIPDSIGHLKSLNYLHLSSCGLIGALPKSLVNLKHLIYIDLSYNMLNGTLPSFLFTIPSIKGIYFKFNKFSGGLPSELFNCRSLNLLSLRDNQFDDEINEGSIRPSFIQLINLTFLDLSYNKFRGLWDLDTWLAALPNLVTLELSYSGLTVVTNNVSTYVNPDFHWLGLGNCMLTVFPQSLKAMKNLGYLDLSSNNIKGSIPEWAAEIGRNELFILNVSYNSITSLPQFQWEQLEVLYLQSNQIEGPFPPSICNMSILYYLDISNNRFVGEVPQCFGIVISNAVTVNLGNNYFSGVVPNGYDNCQYLEGIILNGNYFEGELPSSLSKCRSLKVVDLGNNHLNGTFPGFLGDLPMLQVVILKSNNFYGTIETSSTMEIRFRSLKVLDLSCNAFVGHLPGKYIQNFIAMKGSGNNFPKLEYLNARGWYYYSINIVVKDSQLLFSRILVDYTIVDLSNNRFEGEIPDAIGSLNSLKVLNLSHNCLNGRIPPAIGSLSNIESLDLSWNQLIGEIPKSLADITTLEVLNLSQNHLVGRIPEGTQFSTFETSFGGNPELCGQPLPNKCEHPHQQQHEVVEEDLESGFVWRAVILGYGCGVILGLVLGYVMLSTGRPMWFNEIVDA